MSETAENKNTINQGKNMRFAREFRGISQEDLAHKINKHQSEISKIENQGTVDGEILEQIALALEVSPDFLKTFDFEDTAKNYYNNSTNTINEHGQNYQGHADTINNYPLSEVMEMTTRLLDMQKEHYEKEMLLLTEKHELGKKNALLKQELEFLKNKK